MSYAYPGGLSECYTDNKNVSHCECEPPIGFYEGHVDVNLLDISPYGEYPIVTCITTAGYTMLLDGNGWTSAWTQVPAPGSYCGLYIKEKCKKDGGDCFYTGDYFANGCNNALWQGELSSYIWFPNTDNPNVSIYIDKAPNSLSVLLGKK